MSRSSSEHSILRHISLNIPWKGSAAKAKRRWQLSKDYISGKGLELGASNDPLRVRKNVRVIYVDRIDQFAALIHFPELDEAKFTPVDVLDDGENLCSIARQSQDFLIANHFLEHCQNPIAAIKTHLSRIKVGGILYYAVPDKRKTFDIKRPLTSFEHILRDYRDGPEASLDAHLHEHVDFIEGEPFRNEPEERVQHLKNINRSIHFHVWDANSFLDFLNKTNEVLGYPFSIVEYVRDNDNENIAILRKAKNCDEDDINRFLKALKSLYLERADLQAAFPEVATLGKMGRLIAWGIDFGIRQDNGLAELFSLINSRHSAVDQ